jgi:hypothetical protein
VKFDNKHVRRDAVVRRRQPVDMRVRRLGCVRIVRAPQRDLRVAIAQAVETDDIVEFCGNSTLFQQRHQHGRPAQPWTIRLVVVFDLPRRVVIGGQISVDCGARLGNQRRRAETAKMRIPVGLQAQLPSIVPGINHPRVPSLSRMLRLRPNSVSV